jgi:pyruvate/2-oxoacid:ferredoxin oxidoreductase alpha subunit
MRTLLKGNGAVARAVQMAGAQVISAYPITPQTSIVEELAEMVAQGRLNARFIKVESEHSALAACIAAASVGARTFTATSSQGLALMHELLHWAAGSRLPIVMVNVNRALGSPWSLFTEQTDSLSQRDTGWMQIYCQSAQEALDSVIQSFEVSQRVLLPCMVLLDGFLLSHTFENVEVPEQDTVDSFLGPLKLPHLLDVARPATIGGLSDPDSYTAFRRKIQIAHEQALEVWADVGRQWGELTGRGYDVIEEYRLHDAELVLVASSTPAMTARVAIDALRERGIPAGLLRLRVFRPFPANALRRALARKRAVVVLDRNCSFGHHGIFYQETKSALYELPAGDRPPVRGIIAGLGGRDITPEDIEQMLLQGSESKGLESVTWWKTLPEEEQAVEAEPCATTN